MCYGPPEEKVNILSFLARFSAFVITPAEQNKNKHALQYVFSQLGHDQLLEMGSFDILASI